jgi:hypothetical protein
MPMGVMAPLAAKMNAAIAPEVLAEKDAVIAELRETNQVRRRGGNNSVGILAQTAQHALGNTSGRTIYPSMQQRIRNR